MPVPLVSRRFPGRRARPAVEPAAAVRAAGELVAAGRRVSLALPDPATARSVGARLAEAGLSAHCEVTIRPGDGGPASAPEGLPVDVALAGPAGVVDPVARALPGARVVIAAGSPWAEQRCRAFAGRRVRLVADRGPVAERAFVRCLNVLMAGDGRPALATVDPRLVAITGERAAWNGRAPDSWEFVMPWGRATEDQHRLLAAGHVVRIHLPVLRERA